MVVLNVLVVVNVLMCNLQIIVFLIDCFGQLVLVWVVLNWLGGFYCWECVCILLGWWVDCGLGSMVGLLLSRYLQWVFVGVVIVVCYQLLVEWVIVCIVLFMLSWISVGLGVYIWNLGIVVYQQYYRQICEQFDGWCVFIGCEFGEGICL